MGGGKTFNECPVISPNDITSLSCPLVLIATPHANYIREISDECQKLGVEAGHIDDVIFRLYKDRIWDCLELFDDDRSREIYAEMILCRMEGRRPDPSYVTSKSLFNVPEFMAADYDGNMIDCGAFVGDSLESYITERESSYAFFGRIVAFEPDRDNFEALQRRVNRLKSEWCLSDDKIILYNAGVGEKSTISRILHAENNAGSIIVDEDSSDSVEVQTYAIDDIVKEPYSYLKADIESYEYQMLQGAEKTIKRYNPNLGICIYHNAFDMLQIPLLIHEMVPEYRMIVRQHNFHTSETHVYAWIDD